MTRINDGQPFRTRDADQLGYNRHDLDDALSTRSLRSVFPGVVVDATVSDTRDLRLEAVKLVRPPDAIVSDHTAAWLHGVDTMPPGMLRDLRVMCTVPHGRHRIASSRVQVRQVVVPDHEAVWLRDVAVTSPLRTVGDLLRLSWRPYALAAADAMVRAGVVELLTVQEYVASMPRLPYVRQARELAPVIDKDAASHGESWMRCRMLDAGFPIPVLQHEVTLNDGRRRYLDTAFPAVRVAAEYDGRTHHSTETDVSRDEARREEVIDQLYWRIAVGTQDSILGADPAFEIELGGYLGIVPRPRSW